MKKIILRIRAISEYFVAPLIVMTICLVLFALKGIHPFGDGIIDVIDMTQMNVPLYYHLWDFMHGTKNLFFDWYTGLSVNMAESVGIGSLISPFNLFFFLIPRDEVYLSMGLFTMLKFMGSAGVMYFFLKKNFRVSAFWLNALSGAYAFSGYAVMYYSNSQWLDIMALFPLIMHFLWKMFKTGRTIPYIITLAACLIINMYIGIMVLLFIFLISGLYALFVSKTARKRLINLGVGTLTAAALSAIIVMPTYAQTTASARFGADTELIPFYLGLMEAKNTIDLNKFFLLFPCALPLAITVLGMFGNIRNKNNTAKSRSQKKIAAFCACGILLVALPLFFETTNLIWHGGSYMMFPVRFGFLLTFMMTASACYYVSISPHINRVAEKKPENVTLSLQFTDREDTEPAENDSQSEYVTISLWTTPLEITAEAEQSENVTLRLIPTDPHAKARKTVAGVLLKCFGAFVTAAAAAWSILKIGEKSLKFTETHHNIFAPELLKPSIVTAIAAFVVYALLVCKGNTKVNYRLAGVLLLIEVFCFSYVYIGYSPESSTYVRDANRVKESLHLREDRLSGIKTVGHTFNTNYPFILQRPSISNWTHTIPSERQAAISKFGYTTVYTRMVDTGGTVFSDALFGVRNTLSVAELDADLYEPLQKGAGYNYYNNKYTLPFGLPVSGEALAAVNYDDPNPFFFTQNLFSSMFPEKAAMGDLVHIIKYGGDTDPLYITDHTVTGESLSVNISVTGKKALYFAPLGDSRVARFSVNGKTVAMPTSSNKQATHFPDLFDQRIVCLGAFENESVNLNITYQSGSEIGSGMVAQLDLDIMGVVSDEWRGFDTHAVAGKNTLSMNVDVAPETEYRNTLFLPISYDSGWSCKVNGEKAELQKVMGSFIGVPLRAGGNSIEMSFAPDGMAKGFFLSLIAVIGLTAYLVLKRRGKLRPIAKKYAAEYDSLRGGVYALFMALWFGFMTVMYFAPIVYSFVNKFLIDVQ